jgi:hypothetical protein
MLGGRGSYIALSNGVRFFLLKDFAAGDTAGFEKPSDDGNKKRGVEIKIPTPLFRLECSVRN